MADIRLQPPEAFDFKNPDDWTRWKRRFEQFRIASSLDTQSDSKQVSMLLYSMGEEAEVVLVSTGITDEERKSYKKVVEKLDEYFHVRHNVIFERARFNRRDQLEGESGDQYITELYSLAERCSYGQLTSEMIRDRLVVGIRDLALSERLQLNPDLTLEKAKTMIRQREAVHTQQQVLKEAESGSSFKGENSSMDFLRGQGTKTKPAGVSSAKPKQTPKQCVKCGKGQHPWYTCPAKESVCHKCKRRGHYGSQCLSKTVAELQPDESNLDSAFLDTLTQNSPETWRVKLKLANQTLEFKIDTGAEVTAISDAAFRALKGLKLDRPKKMLYGPARTLLKVIGQFEGELFYRGKTTRQKVYVVNGLRTNLLGLPAILALKLVAKLEETVEASLHTIVEKYPTLFQGLGSMGDPYDIQLQPEAQPYALFTSRNIPLPLCLKVKQELERMESLGIISKVDEPTPWCAGMVVAPKKGGAIRICVDYQPLNRYVCREVYPLPKVDETLAQLAGAKIFSKLDANSGFWQIPLTERSKLLTTFITPFGRYYFTNFRSGFAMDDVLVFGRDKEEHNARLIAALNRIRDAGVTLNREKCEFEKGKLLFLGHVIDQHGVQADPEKTSAIEGLSSPSNITELRRFLGMANQMGKFSPNLAQVTQPLRELLSKNRTWQWGCAQEEAFAQVKAELCKPTVLAFYTPDAPTKLSADASSHGLGAVLLQRSDGEWKPVAYASRSMSETEKRYAQIEKEALATVWACDKFASYIVGLKVHIETDHKPLVPLLGSKHLDTLPPRILRFRLRLARFDFTIQHVPGKLSGTADALSRAPGPITNLPQTLEHLKPEWPYLLRFQEQDLEFKSHQKSNYDRHHRVHQLPDIPDQTEVWITTDKSKPTPGIVVGKAGAPRSYIVETQGGLARRNRHHLNVVPNVVRQGAEEPQQPDSLEQEPEQVEKPQQPNTYEQEQDHQPQEPHRIMTRSQTGTAIRPPERFGWNSTLARKGDVA
ncbi:hypothetical protein EMCRGX_G006423 [Ephydatia muelleri]|eukprot:Em0024g28a